MAKLIGGGDDDRAVDPVIVVVADGAIPIAGRGRRTDQGRIVIQLGAEHQDLGELIGDAGVATGNGLLDEQILTLQLLNLRVGLDRILLGSPVDGRAVVVLEAFPGLEQLLGDARLLLERAGDGHLDGLGSIIRVSHIDIPFLFVLCDSVYILLIWCCGCLFTGRIPLGLAGSRPFPRRIAYRRDSCCYFHPSVSSALPLPSGDPSP